MRCSEYEAQKTDINIYRDVCMFHTKVAWTYTTFAYRLILSVVTAATQTSHKRWRHTYIYMEVSASGKRRWPSIAVRRPIVTAKLRRHYPNPPLPNLSAMTLASGREQAPNSHPMWQLRFRSAKKQLFFMSLQQIKHTCILVCVCVC